MFPVGSLESVDHQLKGGQSVGGQGEVEKGRLGRERKVGLPLGHSIASVN